jgi:hypothetical protein
MVQGVSSGGHVGMVAITALRYAQSEGRDVVMPVRRSQMVYANFKHIQVRPDSRQEDGVPLYKLKILDTLIEQLSKKNGTDTAGKATAAGIAGRAAAGSAVTVKPTVEQVDALIAGISGQLRAVGPSYRAGFLPEPGAFVDLVA